MTTRRQFERNDLKEIAANRGYYFRTRASFDYWTNRENGQLVKRESPCSILVGQFSDMKADYVSGANAIGNTPHGIVVNAWSPTGSKAYLRAYEKFKKAMKRPTSEVLLNIVEANKSLEMIAARAFQLTNLVRAVKQGRLGDAWRYLSANPDLSLLAMKDRRRRDSRFTTGKARERNDDKSRERRRMLKDVSALILEIRYGWSPLMQDIVSALEVLKRQPTEAIPLRVTATWKYSQSLSQQQGPRKISCSFVERVTIKGTFKQKNSFLSLANDLGFLNPAGIVWETIPFSFLIDWALPIGPWLQNLTDFVSIELTDGSITGKCESTGEFDQYGYGLSSPHPFQIYSPLGRAYIKKYVRTVGLNQLPPPPLFWDARLSPGRAINAIALLGTTLNPKVVRAGRSG